MSATIRLLRVVVLSLALSVSAFSASNVVISQVYGGGGNAGSTLKNDFIELFNRGSEPVDLSGWSVQYASATGSTWFKTDLNGTIQPGQYFLVREAQGAAGTVNLPPADAIGNIAMSSAGGKVALVNSTTLLTGTSPAGIVDLIGYSGTANFFETAAAPGLSNTTANFRANNGCIDTDNNAVDFVVGAPAPRNTASPFFFCDTLPPPPPPLFPIHEVQGAGSRSSHDGEILAVEGIVTARKFNNGFFVQAAESEYDTDPNTSEGIFVFTSSAPPAAAAVGNRVRVTGTVQEFVPSADPVSPPLTEIVSPTVELLTTGNALPGAAVLTVTDTSPSGSIEQLEKYEGMRVHVASLTTTSPTDGSVSEANATATSNGIFYAVITGTPRPFREAGIETPHPLPAGAPAAVPIFDANPERLRVDSDGQIGATRIDVTSGATIIDVTGVLDYGFRTYTILPDPTPAPTVSSGMTVQTVPLPSGEEITVASANLERFFDTVNDDGISDVELSAAAFERRLAKLSLIVRDVLHSPDIIGVQEVENLATLQAIADRLNTDRGTPGDYVAFLEEGLDPGGIDVGVLVKTSRITVNDVEQVGKQATFINPDDGQPDDLNDRPPLVLDAAVRRTHADDLHLFVVVNHLRSLNDVETAPRVRAKRRAQAEFLANLLDDLQEGGVNVISVGDYNAFSVNDGYVDVMSTVLGSPTPAEQVTLASLDLVDPNFVDLRILLPADQQYSYVFDGNAQELDHAIVNTNLLARVSRFAIARVNADFPESLRGDSTRPERISDHDPSVAYITLPAQDFTPPAINITSPGDGASFTVGQAVTATYTCSDSGGVETCAGTEASGATIDTSKVGAQTFTVDSADRWGNAASASVSYTVSFAPCLLSNNLSKNAGSAAPVKVQICDAAGNNLSSAATTLQAVALVDPAGGQHVPPDAGNANRGGWFRFDATLNGYIFNLSTKGLAPGSYVLWISAAGDPKLHAVTVTLN